MTELKVDQHRAAQAGLPEGRKLKLLLVSGYFSPAEATGAIRATHLAKYFHRLGFETTVVCVDQRRSPSSIDVPFPAAVKVVRVPHTQGLLINDLGVNNIRGVFGRVRQIAEREGVDVLYITGSPFFLFNCALVKFIVGKPLRVYIEYRDLWSGEPRVLHSAKDALFRAFGYLNEIMLAFVADRLVFISRSMMKDQLEWMPWFARDAVRNRALVSTTGYDEDDFADITYSAGPWRNEGDTFVLSHFGNLHLDMSIPQFVEAVAGIENVIVKLYGRFNDKMIDAVAASKRGAFVDCGPLSHRGALEEMKKADVLLLLGADSTQRLHRKVFEYLASGRPTVYVGPVGAETARVIEACGGGVIIPNSDTAAIRAMLEDLRDGILAIPPVQPQRLERYAKGAIVEELKNDILDGRTHAL